MTDLLIRLKTDFNVTFWIRHKHGRLTLQQHRPRRDHVTRFNIDHSVLSRRTHIAITAVTGVEDGETTRFTVSRHHQT